MIGPYPTFGGQEPPGKRIIGPAPRSHSRTSSLFAGGAQCSSTNHIQRRRCSMTWTRRRQLLPRMPVALENSCAISVIVSPAAGCMSLREDRSGHSYRHPAGRPVLLSAEELFGGLWSSRSSTTVSSQHRTTIQTHTEIIEQTHRRLARVQNRIFAYQQILEKYDRPTTLFYADPPYWERKALPP